MDSQTQASIDALGRLLRHYDRTQLWFQLTEVVAERTYLQHGIDVREGDVVLDVGANVGVAAAFFASECGAALVHSFEPVPPLFELLRENVRHWDACVAHGYGLASAPGTAQVTFYPDAAAMSGLYADPEEDRARVRRYLTNSGVSPELADRQLEGRYRGVTLSCELRTISTVLREQYLRHVDLLKIDVEKAELDVLAGIEDGDWWRIRQIVVEVHGDDDRIAAISDLLIGHGFSVDTEADPLWRDAGICMLYARRT
jgi:FkbM family methyltransferase